MKTESVNSPSTPSPLGCSYQRAPTEIWCHGLQRHACRLTEPQRSACAGDIGAEFGRVLGGGVRAGSLVLVGGGPGLGKSTLLLQLAALAAAAPAWRAPAGSPLAGASDRVLYITGEEAAEQVADRAERLQVDDCGRVDVLCENDMDAILEVLHERRPKVAILDSVQTVSLADVSGSNGSVSQVRPASNRPPSISHRTSSAMKAMIEALGGTPIKPNCSQHACMPR